MTNTAMQIDPIRTEQEHDDALARITVLMGSARGTTQADELKILATAVDAYEAKHFPIDAPDPIVAAQFRIEQQGRPSTAKPNARRRIQPK